MSGGKSLAEPRAVEYLYDGSLAGLYCCVYESVYEHEIPSGIHVEGESEPSFFIQRAIKTDPERAKRVRSSVRGKICVRALELIEGVFLSCLAEKELAILNFLLLGYREGAKTVSMMGHPVVSKLLKAERHMGGEVHLLKGFVRFSDYGGILASEITPKNYVLPFLAPHFAARYPEENFMIYDKTHKAALFCEKGRQRILPLEKVEFSEADETEKTYRAMWKQFYNTIAIAERENPRLRMSHMPKRYWENMLEVKDLL